jgi:hypothetical protein
VYIYAFVGTNKINVMIYTTVAVNIVTGSSPTDSLTPPLQTNQQVLISLQEDATAFCLTVKAKI